MGTKDFFRSSSDDRSAQHTIIAFTAPVFINHSEAEPTLVKADLELTAEHLELSFDAETLRIPTQQIADVSIGTPPEALSSHFEYALKLRYMHPCDGILLIGGDTTPMRKVACRILEIVLDGSDAHVEQSRIPTHIDGGESTTHREATTIQLPAKAGEIRFDDADLLPVAIPTITGVERVDHAFEEEMRPALRVRHLPREQRASTTISLESAEYVDLLERHLVSGCQLTPLAGSIRVLFVDDEPGLAGFISEYIERERDDFHVETATSVSQALRTLEDQRIECIISDFALKGDDAWTLLREARDQFPSLPFILYTRRSEDQLPDGIIANVTNYFQKRTGTDQYDVLIEQIERIVADNRDPA